MIPAPPAPLPSPLLRFSWSNWARVSRAHLTTSGIGSLPATTGQALLAVLNATLALFDHPAPGAPPAVLIVGHQRSGTTFLHRMLARHPEATALPLHGLLLPSDAAQGLFTRLDRPAWLDRAQDRLLAGVDTFHRLRLHEPEEDEFLLWALHRSPMNALDRPWPPGGPRAVGHDAVAFAVYADAVARASRRAGRYYVGKNPHFTADLPALRAALPTAKVIHLVRHPAEAVASRLSLLRAIWRARDPSFGELARHHVEGLLANSLANYRGGLAAAGVVDLELPYPELIADPVRAVQHIHACIGLPEWPAAALAELRVAVEGGELRSNERVGRSPLAHFGLSRERLKHELSAVYQRWGWD